MWNLISGLKTLRENSGQIFLLAIWSLDVLKRIVNIFPKRLLNKEIKKAGLKFNPGLGLIGLWTTGPSFSQHYDKNTFLDRWYQCGIGTKNYTFFKISRQTKYSEICKYNTMYKKLFFPQFHQTQQNKNLMITM